MDDLDLGSTIKGFSPGQKVFARYTLQRILGRGGMGVVWLARDEELERDVALKFLPEVVAMDKQSVNELKRETRRSLELTHPHIIRIYDFVQDGRAAAISMEYVAGDTLAALKADRPGHCFAPADLVKWVEQLVDALAHAHGRAQVVHRDLKPANLMIDARGELKVADFGIAASVSDSVSRVSATAGSSGTPVYMSPQQMMGEKPAVTDDIYSLGATVYDLLTGKPPFHSGNVIAQVQSKVPPSVADRRAELGAPPAEIPPAWEATLAACLAKDAADRPQSAREFLERLRGASPTGGGSPVAPVTAPPVERAATPAPAPRTEPRPAAAAPQPSRGPLVATLVALGLVLLVLCGGAYYYYGIHRPAEARRLAAEQVEDSRRGLARLTAEIEALLQSGDWDRAEEQLKYLGPVFRRDHPAAVHPDMAEAEGRLRQALVQGRERARLAALRIPVTLRTNPSGAEIFVDGQSRGLTPVAGLPLPLGQHKLVARLANHEELEQTLTVEERGQSEWLLALVRSTGRLRLTSDPAEASFEVFALNATGERQGGVVRRGALPTEELSLPTGRYEVRVVSTIPGSTLEATERVTVRRGETVSFAADVRGGSLQVTSTPAGAAVWIDGVEVGRTPYTLAHQPYGSSRRVELRLADHEPQQRIIAFERSRRTDTWAATLRELPKRNLMPDLRQGPTRLRVAVQGAATTTVRSNFNGQVQTTGPTRTDSTLTTDYEVLSWTADGWPQVARAQMEAARMDTLGLKPGTVVEFQRTGNGWARRFVTGGFASASGDIRMLNPALPQLWLSSEVLPAGPAEVGRTWDVPVRAAGLLLTGYLLAEPKGFIRARVTGADPVGEDAWAEVEYTYELAGENEAALAPATPLPAGFSMEMPSRWTGTLTLRVELGRGLVTRARSVSRGYLVATVHQQQTASIGLSKSLLVGPVAAAATAPSNRKVLSSTTTEIEQEVTFTVEPLTGGASLRAVQATFEPPPRPAKVTVYFYRKNKLLTGVAAGVGLAVGGQRYPTVKDGRYLVAELEPGVTRAELAHMIGNGVVRSQDYSIEIAPGRANYFEVSLDREMIQPSPAEVGEALVRQLRLQEDLRGATAEGAPRR